MKLILTDDEGTVINTWENKTVDEFGLYGGLEEVTEEIIRQLRREGRYDRSFK